MKKGEADPALETEWGSLEVVGRGGGACVVRGSGSPPPPHLMLPWNPNKPTGGFQKCFTMVTRSVQGVEFPHLLAAYKTVLLVYRPSYKHWLSSSLPPPPQPLCISR